MKTYNDNFKGAANNRSNWEMVKEFGTNFVGANAYDYVIIVRKNGERLMCSDAESWEENIKGLRLASVAYCLMWCAFEYSDDQREEAKANGESLTRGVSSVIDFTANEAGYIEYLEEVLANRSNTECEYYNGTTGATAKDNGTADTIAQDHTEHTGESEQYKQLQEAMDALYKLGRTARAKGQKLMHKFCDTLEAEDKAAWIAQAEICHDIDEREEKLQTLWHECQDAWNEYHAPKVAKILAALEAETTEDENTTTEDNTPQGGKEAPEREELPTVENSPASDKIRKACHEVATRTAHAAKKAGALLALGLVLCSALFLLGLAAVLMGGTFDALELTGAPRVLLACVLLFTVIIDLIAWAEINAMICLNRLHIFDNVGGFNRDLCQYLRPFSVIGLFIRTFREA